MKNFNKKNKGFTLIEILVVIGIIAILAAIVIIAINPAKQFAQARNTQRTSNVNAILNAVGQRIADNKGVFEGSFNWLDDGDDNIKGNADDNYSYYCDEIPLAAGDNIITSGMGTKALGNDSPDLGCLVPTYISALPLEPLPSGAQYTIELLPNDRIEVCAPEAANEDAIPDAEEICVTR